MNKYEIRVIPKYDVSNKIYWTAFFPEIEECIGCGNSIEEAINEAEENLEFYLEYLKDEKLPIPAEYKEPSCSGKIALRISKSTHKNLMTVAEREGISVNLLINNAIECYIGKKLYDIEFNQKVQQIKELSENTLKLQIKNLESSYCICKNMGFRDKIQYMGGNDE